MTISTNVDARAEATTSTEAAPFSTWKGIPLFKTDVRDNDAHIEVIAGTGVEPNAPSDDQRTVVVINDVGGNLVEKIRLLTQSRTGAPSGVMLLLSGEASARSIAQACEVIAKTIREQLKEHAS